MCWAEARPPGLRAASGAGLRSWACVSPSLSLWLVPPNHSLQRTRRQSLRSFLLAAELDIVRHRNTALVPHPVATRLPTFYSAVESLRAALRRHHLAHPLPRFARFTFIVSAALVAGTAAAEYFSLLPSLPQHPSLEQRVWRAAPLALLALSSLLYLVGLCAKPAVPWPQASGPRVFVAIVQSLFLLVLSVATAWLFFFSVSFVS